MKNLLLQLLYFSKSERRSAFFLVIVGFGVLLLPNLLKQVYWKFAPPSEAWENELLDHFQKTDAPIERKDTLQPFAFDPNETSLEKLLDMNFPSSVAHNIVKYREKGGRFKRKDDLKKIYGLDSSLFAEIEPFIHIEFNETPESGKPSKAGFRPSKPKIKTIDINQALREDWQAFYGIGPVLSGRIIKFREALGGFSNIDQVGNTYGLQDSVFQKIRPYLSIDSPVHRININQVSLEDLASHPYISWKLSRLIIAFRAQHGPFNSIEELEKMKELPEDFFLKAGPYLTVE